MLTMTDYLSELAELLQTAVGSQSEPPTNSSAWPRHMPAFASATRRFSTARWRSCTRPARDLQRSVSETVWLRLGQGMAACIGELADVLRRGVDTGAFALDDPDYTANLLWTQTLGAMHLARIGVGVRELSPGIPELFSVAPDEVVRSCVASAIATARAQPA